MQQGQLNSGYTTEEVALSPQQTSAINNAWGKSGASEFSFYNTLTGPVLNKPYVNPYLW